MYDSDLMPYTARYFNPFMSLLAALLTAGWVTFVWNFIVAPEIEATTFSFVLVLGAILALRAILSVLFSVAAVGWTRGKLATSEVVHAVQAVKNYELQLLAAKREEERELSVVPDEEE